MGNSRYFMQLQAGNNNSGPAGVPGVFTWWQGSSLTGYSNGEAISLWPDSSGNGHSLVNTDPSTQPIYVASTSNGQPGVGFRGSNLLKSVSSNPYLFELTTPMSFFFVSCLIQPGSNFPTTAVIVDNEASNGIVLRYIPLGGDQGFRAYPGLDQDSDGLITPNNYNYFSVRQAGTTTTAGSTNIRIQGTNLGTGSPVTFTSPDTQLLMGQDTEGDQLYGNICEFISYTRYLTDSETLKIETYLASKYGL